MASIKEKYDNLCIQYVSQFQKKNDFLDVETIDEHGGNYDCDGYIFNFRDIRTDVDNNVHKTFCREYHDYAYDACFMSISCMNYANWLRFTKEMKRFEKI